MSSPACARCGSVLPESAKFCVMCGQKVGGEAPAVVYGTSTLTGSGFVVAIATAVIAASIVAGIAVLVQSFE